MTIDNLLEGERVILRPLVASDAPAIYRHLQDKAIVRWTSNIPWPYKKAHSVSFIKNSKEMRKTMKGFNFGVVPKGETEVVGIVGLMKYDAANKKAELGYWLAKPYWGRGIMTESAGLAVDFAFSKLKCHRVYVRAFKANIASNKIIQKLGFKFEGIDREADYRFGKWQDTVRYGLLRKEYKKA
jgi:ribosomal-protein-alanine N-acetyltransferase